MSKGLLFIGSNIVRHSPNLFLRIFFFWIAYGVLYHKYNILKGYYEFNIKKGKKENKRVLLFKLSCLN